MPVQACMTSAESNQTGVRTEVAKPYTDTHLQRVCQLVGG